MTSVESRGRFVKRPEKPAVTADVSATVVEMLDSVAVEGEAAVRRYSRDLDGWDPADFRVSPETIEAAVASVPPDLMAELVHAVEQIRTFAQHQRACLLPLDVEIAPGIRLGHRLMPVNAVGAYVPGGRYPLIASAFMTIATAKVAGVARVVAVAPPQRDGGGIHPVQLTAMHLAGADEIYAVGGVQALAAISFGVQGFGAPVDMLVGAGNDYVTEAKRQLFGRVGIDALAGPSELGILADDSASAELVAADLLGQAEHGPTSEVYLVTTSENLARDVIAAVDRQLVDLPTRDTAAVAWRDRGSVIVCDNRESAVAVMNDMAPEHLEVQTDDLDWYFEHIDSYGTVFLGPEATVAFSDKAIGTNHVLPTSQSAKYTGGLWVGSFLRVLTHQRIAKGSGDRVAHATYAISKAEGMHGHAETARRRFSGV